MVLLQIILVDLSMLNQSRLIITSFTMRIIVLATFSCFAFLFVSSTLIAQGSVYDWAHGLGDGQGGNDKGNSIVVDSFGNTYVTGTFEGKVDFDPSASFANLKSRGDRDIFIAKYDQSGNYIWVKRIGGTDEDQVNTIKIDIYGDIVITGYFLGTSDFDPSSATANLTSNPTYDSYLAKYDDTGSYIWAKMIGGAGVNKSADLAIDGSGNIYLTGYFLNPCDFDPSNNVEQITNNGNTDAFIAKYDVSGNYLWAKNMGGFNFDAARAIELDANNNIYITGTFQGTADFDPSSSNAYHTEIDFLDIFIAKYDESGNYIWSKAIGGNEEEVSSTLAIDSDGNVFISGYFRGNIDFDPSPSMEIHNAVNMDNLYIAKYDSSGNYLWAHSFDNFFYQKGRSIEIDSNNDVYLSGYIEDVIDFDPSSSTAELNSNGKQDVFVAKYDGSGNYLWAFNVGDWQSDEGFSICLDDNGSLFSTGFFSETPDFDPSTSNVSNQTSVIDKSMFVAEYDVIDGSYINSYTVEDGNGFSDRGTSVTTDSSGHIYVLGDFSKIVDFDPSAGQSYLSSNGNNDIFLVKYDSGGNFMWVKNIGDAYSNDVGNCINFDGDNHIYITGGYRGTVDFDPSSSTLNLSSSGSYDVFLSKFDLDGNFVWAKSMGGSEYDIGQSTKVDDNGNVYLTGYYRGVSDFDPSGSTANISSLDPAYYDAFIAKYDSLGNYLWAISTDGVKNVKSFSVSLDSENNPYITGDFAQTADFDPSGVVNELVTDGSSDVFLAKYSASGNYLWARRIGGPSFDEGNSLSVDDAGNAYITGRYRNTCDFNTIGGPANLTATNSGYDEIYLAKYDSLGNYLWAKSMGGQGHDEAYSVTLGIDQNPFITGGYEQTANFNLSGSATTLTSEGNEDVFIAKYDTLGNFLWVRGMGGPNNDKGNDIVIDKNGDPIVTGLFQDSVDFNPNGYDAQLYSNGWNDIFISKYTDCQTYSIDSILSCDSYTWIDGNTYTSSNNIATHTLTNSAGCDSLVFLDLTIINSSSGTDVQTACDSYTWVDGNTYTSSNNTATHVLTNAAGCDSLVTLELTIINSTAGTDVQTACDSYTWIDGNTYTTSNNSATYTLTNAVGCDSVVTLDLTIYNSVTHTDVISACDSHTWIDGNTYTTDNNTATELLTTSTGCDSLVTLDLTIYNPVNHTDIISACDSFTWIDGVTYTTDNNTATELLTTSTGCDSLVELDLTIINSTTGIDSHVSCDSYTWIDGNTYTIDNNTATFVLSNAAGCDSIITLDLTINSVNSSISIINDTALIANQSGVGYQWVDCGNNFQLIIGEEDQIYSPYQSGSYAVIVDNGSCSDTSDCAQIDFASIDESKINSEISVYPNPAFSNLMIDLRKQFSEVNVTLLSSVGKVLCKKQFLNRTSINLDLSYPPGTYLLYLECDGEYFYRKVVLR